ncbi:hypothetical protein GGTG_07776 [Gaeumannomyces tritici R3-111a-1]|uniref:Secreted protein n=1 Tax=Gaeumannomyces tritici (strain R3-111a-1) TaxID=644352 RepID=J3P2N0_GAET3|nr:hypothetical protein GGTG_07776 [Gaeumannomyces tritici R3-111a-1]EJT73922.1 hypothetical protein GGTG_07776 [Gaeumannomyces tritici R3-111a-1]
MGNGECCCAVVLLCWLGPGGTLPSFPPIGTAGDMEPILTTGIHPVPGPASSPGALVLAAFLYGHFDFPSPLQRRLSFTAVAIPSSRQLVFAGAEWLDSRRPAQRPKANCSTGRQPSAPRPLTTLRLRLRLPLPPLTTTTATTTTTTTTSMPPSSLYH